MARRFVLGCAVCGLLLAGGLVAGQRPQDVDLQKAIRTETIDGDLAAAIRQYEALAATYASTDRAVAAQALLRMADSYRKLGDPRHRQVYEQVARTYGDLPVASVARAQLGTAVGGVTTRSVWQYGDRDISNVSSNGKVVTAGFGSRNLMIRDLTSGAERPVAVDSRVGVLSQDGSLVVYSSRERLWILPIDVNAPQPSLPSTLVETGSQPIALSPDKTLLATQGEQPDQTAQIRLVRMADGKMQTLKSINWRGTSAAFFSPDGRFLLYDAPATDTDLNRDVFLIAVDGSRESTIAHPKDDRVAGWSPDGRSVLFVSDRRGSNDLWRQAVIDGRPAGTPELIVPEVGTVRAMGVTSSGAVYLNRSVGGPDVETIGVDLVAGRQTTAPVRPIASHVGFNRRPAWSPDGKSLLAMLEDPILVVHSMETGRDRELSLVADLTWIAGPAWSPDGRQIAVIGNDMKGRHGVFRIDGATGAVTPVTFTGSTPQANDTGRRLTYEGPMWSPDGTKLYYHTANSGGVILEWTFATGQEREIARAVGTIGLSPDGQSIATSRGNANELVIVPVGGGAPRVLWRLGEGEWINNTSIPWTPDGRAVIVRRMLDAMKSDLWLVPIDGGARRKLDVDASRIATFANGRISVHPDGRQLAYLSNDERRYQVMVVDNILQAAGTSRTP